MDKKSQNKDSLSHTVDRILFVRRVEYPRCLCRGSFFLLSVLFVFAGSFYKLAEQRTGLIWTALEFWVELHTDEERLIAQLNGLDYAAVRGASAQAQSVLAEHLAVVVIELVAVTVALGDILLTVAALHGAALEDVAGIRAETQASALVYIIMLIGQKINDFM